VTLSALLGKKVIVNFWNLNCSWCMQEMPYFQTVRDNHTDSELALLIINSVPADRPEAVGAYLDGAGYTFKVPLDQYSAVAQEYNINDGVPVTFFIDSGGIIRNKRDGAFSNADAIETMLDSY